MGNSQSNSINDRVNQIIADSPESSAKKESPVEIKFDSAPKQKFVNTETEAAPRFTRGNLVVSATSPATVAAVPSNLLSATSPAPVAGPSSKVLSATSPAPVAGLSSKVLSATSPAPGVVPLTSRTETALSATSFIPNKPPSVPKI